MIRYKNGWIVHDGRYLRSAHLVQRFFRTFWNLLRPVPQHLWLEPVSSLEELVETTGPVRLRPAVLVSCWSSSQSPAPGSLTLDVGCFESSGSECGDSSSSVSCDRVGASEPAVNSLWIRKHESLSFCSRSGLWGETWCLRWIFGGFGPVRTGLIKNLIRVLLMILTFLQFEPELKKWI